VQFPGRFEQPSRATTGEVQDDSGNLPRRHRHTHDGVPALEGLRSDRHGRRAEPQVRGHDEEQQVEEAGHDGKEQRRTQRDLEPQPSRPQRQKEGGAEGE